MTNPAVGYAVVKATDAKSFHDLTDDWRKKAIAVVYSIKDIDEETRWFVLKTIGSLFILLVKNIRDSSWTSTALIMNSRLTIVSASGQCEADEWYLMGNRHRKVLQLSLLPATGKNSFIGVLHDGFCLSGPCASVGSVSRICWVQSFAFSELTSLGMPPKDCQLSVPRYQLSACI